MSNTKETPSINWQFTCQITRIYENFKEQYFRSIQIQADCLKDSWSDSYDKNVIKEKVNEILTLVPDKWSQMYCSEYFDVYE